MQHSYIRSAQRLYTQPRPLPEIEQLFCTCNSFIPTAPLTPRQRQETIGGIAGFQPGDTPQLAVLLERANRKIEG